MPAWDDWLPAVAGRLEHDWDDYGVSELDDDWLTHCQDAARSVGCSIPRERRHCLPARDWRSSMDWEARVKLLRAREFQRYYRWAWAAPGRPPDRLPERAVRRPANWRAAARSLRLARTVVVAGWPVGS